jgi:hypothetical protein
VSPAIDSLDLRPEQDPTHELAHRLVADGIAGKVRVVTDDGYVLFTAWDHNAGSPQYAWKTSSMAAPAFWPKASTTRRHRM